MLYAASEKIFKNRLDAIVEMCLHQNDIVWERFLAVTVLFIQCGEFP